MRFYVTRLFKLVDSPVFCGSLRRYARWQHRRPSRVLSAEEFQAERDGEPLPQPDNVIELGADDYKVGAAREKSGAAREKSGDRKGLRQGPALADVKNNSQILFDVRELDAKTHPTEKAPKKQVKYTEQDVLNATFADDGTFIYTKMKDADPKIGSLMLMVKSRKLRTRKEFVLLEGKRLLRDALEAKCVLRHLMFSRKTDVDYIKDLLPKKDLTIYKMAYRDMQMWSDLTTSPGIMGIVDVPNLEATKTQESIRLTIVCDNIREPGNLGAVLRSAAAVGCEKLILSKGCVDVWEPKVLRSATGAHFRVPIHRGVDWDSIPERLDPNAAVFLADNDTSAGAPLLPYYSISYAEMGRVVLVIGGETGLSDCARALALRRSGVRLHVPLVNGVESLNTGTALGILAFEIKRQLAASK